MLIKITTVEEELLKDLLLNEVSRIEKDISQLGGYSHDTFMELGDLILRRRQIVDFLNSKFNIGIL